MRCLWRQRKTLRFEEISGQIIWRDQAGRLVRCQDFVGVDVPIDTASNRCASLVRRNQGPAQAGTSVECPTNY